MAIVILDIAILVAVGIVLYALYTKRKRLAEEAHRRSLLESRVTSALEDAGGWSTVADLRQKTGIIRGLWRLLDEMRASGKVHGSLVGPGTTPESIRIFSKKPFATFADAKKFGLDSRLGSMLRQMVEATDGFRLQGSFIASGQSADWIRAMLKEGCEFEDLAQTFHDLILDRFLHHVQTRKTGGDRIAQVFFPVDQSGSFEYQTGLKASVSFEPTGASVAVTFLRPGAIEGTKGTLSSG